MKRRGVLLVAVLALASGCRSSGPSGPASVEVVRGHIESADPNGAFHRVDGKLELGRGARVRTGPDASALVRVPPGQAELAPDTEIQIRAAGVFIRRGALLASGGLPVLADEGSTTTSGTVRVDRALALRVGAYEGSATLRVGADTLAISRYREATVSPGFFPRVSVPLKLDASDRWDRRLLGDELELDRSLTSFQGGLVLLPAQLSAVLQGLGGAVALSIPLLSAGGSLAPPEVVVATAIAAASPGLLPANASEATTLRAEGASWAVIAATLRAKTEDVLGSLQDAIKRGSPTPLPGQPAATPGSPVISPRPLPVPSPAPTARPTSGSPPPPAPPPPSPSPCSNCGAVTNLLCDVTKVCLNVPL